MQSDYFLRLLGWLARSTLLLSSSGRPLKQSGCMQSDLVSDGLAQRLAVPVAVIQSNLEAAAGRMPTG